MSSHEDYRIEASERCTRESLSCAVADDSFPLSNVDCVVAETAYRRGYYEAMMVAMMATHLGLTAARMSEYIRDELHPWRCARHDGEMQPPPTIRQY